MTCITSLKGENKSLTTPNDGKQINTESEVEIATNKDSLNMTADPYVEEEHKYAGTRRQAPVHQPTTEVNLPVLKRKALGIKDRRRHDNAEFQLKSLAQKEINSVQRRKQIFEYNSLKLKEERQQRYRIRHGVKPLFVLGDTCKVSTSSIKDKQDHKQSKRKKQVSFEF